MFLHLRKTILFLVGLLAGSAVASVAVLGIAWVIDANPATKVAVQSLLTFNSTLESSDSGDELPGQIERLFDNFVTSPYANSRFVKRAAFYSILLEANAEQLAKLFDESKRLRDSTWRQEVQSTILSRLTMINPGIAIVYARESPVEVRQKLLESVFGEWSLQDLRKAVDAGQHLDFPEKEIALKAILHTNVDLPEEQRIAIGQRFGDEKLAQRLIDANRALALVDTPHRAWEVMMADGLDVRFRLSSLIDIAQTLVNRDGIGVLSEIRAHGVGVNSYYPIYHVLVPSIARANPERVFSQAAANPDLQFLLRKVAAVWAETNPVEALEAVYRLDDAEDKMWLTSSIMQSWSEIDPRELLENRAVFPREIESDVIVSAIVELAKTEPREAVGLLENLHIEEEERWALAELLVNVWSENDPDATLDWVLSSATHQNPVRGRMIENSISGLARTDPKRAMEMALNPLSPDWPEALDYSVIWELSRTNVNAASELLPRVSEEYRLSCYIRVGRRYIEEGNPQRTLDLATHLDSAQRLEYYSSTFQWWATIAHAPRPA